MSFNRISAAEAASLIKHGYNIGLSGFTPAGTAKAVTAELAKIAAADRAEGNPFQVGIITAKLSTTEKMPTPTYTSHKWHRKCVTASWGK